MNTNCSLATIEDLVIALGSSCTEAYHMGWLEQQDLQDAHAPIERRHLARILHMFLCLIKKEADEVDTSSAYILKDLYDCRTCSGHVMQIYAKGIMEGHYFTPTLYLFGMKEHVTIDELNTILKRVYDLECRLKH